MTAAPTILIVDDEALIRRGLHINLRREGFTVRTAENADEAIACLKDSCVDLLLTDYLMKGMTGLDLSFRARELCPGVKVILFSGYDDVVSSADIAGHGIDAFVCKPLKFDALLEQISRVFDN